MRSAFPTLARKQASCKSLDEALASTVLALTSVCSSEHTGEAIPHATRAALIAALALGADTAPATNVAFRHVVHHLSKKSVKNLLTI